MRISKPLAPRLRQVVSEEFNNAASFAMLLSIIAKILPPYVGIRLRASLLRRAGWKIGPRCVISTVPVIIGAIPNDNRLTIGNEVSMGIECVLDCAAKVVIGDNATLGHRVSLLTGNHQLGPHFQRLGPLEPEPITIGAGAWICSGAIILPGVTVGDGAVIAAGAVVTSDVPPDTLYGGVPARKIRDLD